MDTPSSPYINANDKLGFLSELSQLNATDSLELVELETSNLKSVTNKEKEKIHTDNEFDSFQDSSRPALNVTAGDTARIDPVPMMM
jgi:hypothetical protein